MKEIQSEKMKKESLMAMPSSPNIMQFEVTLNENYGCKTLRVHVERQKSGANAYGNQTMVAVYVNEDIFQLFDTRYMKEMNTIEGYQEYFEKWVNDSWKENAVQIERIL